MVDVWRYPVNWPAISRRIRERDRQRCRWCGAGEGLFDLETAKPVRLTAMHLDGDPKNCEEWNLVTACRPCQAAYDAPDVTAGRAVARCWTQLEVGQLELFPDLVLSGRSPLLRSLSPQMTTYPPVPVVFSPNRVDQLP